MSESDQHLSSSFIRPDWSVPQSVHVVTTTRVGGVSKKPFESLNLGHHVDDDEHAVTQNRQRLASALALPSDPSWLNQVHGCDIVEVAQPLDFIPEADAAISAQFNLVLAILTADCLPLVLVDVRRSLLGVVHCGWRGLANGIIDKTLQKMGGEPEDISAWLGPAIGPNCFEVGDEVWDQFVSKDWQMAKCFSATGNQSFNANIYAIATRQLHQAGVHAISGGEYCTVTDSELFYSYRRDGQTGRMATLAWMTPDVDPR